MYVPNGYLNTWSVDGRLCTRCREWKPWDAFRPRAKGKNGRTSACRLCTNVRRQELRRSDPEKYRAKDREWARKSGSHIRKRYGLNLDEYNAMVISQGGRCAICDKAPKRLVVDHCHRTNVVRGLLCDRCNHRLHVVDEPGLLEAMLAYVAPRA